MFFIFGSPLTWVFSVSRPSEFVVVSSLILRMALLPPRNPLPHYPLIAKTYDNHNCHTWIGNHQTVDAFVSASPIALW
jgi:hypothetical protein